MTETPTPTPEQKEQLELLKLRAELDKLAAEVPKLRNDNRWWNRHTAAVVSAAAVFISCMTLLNTCSTQREQKERSAREQNESLSRQAQAQIEQKDRTKRDDQRLDGERSIRCVEVGMKVAEFTEKQLARLGATPPAATPQSTAAKEQDFQNLVNTVVRVFPPAEAAAILRALQPTLPRVVSDFAANQQPFEDVLLALENRGATAGCDRLTDAWFELRPERPRQVAAAPPAPAPAPEPALGDNCPTVPAPAADAESLRVFTQVVQSADRDIARRILDRARTLDSAFDRAPIEDVRARNPADQRAEVRYYFARQRDEAERLVALIRRAACQEGLGARVEGLRAVFIGDRFQNLPGGRIELWFPQLAQR